MKSLEETGDIRQSGLVSSSQDGVHPQLEKCVSRHLASAWSEPLHQPTEKIYGQLQKDVLEAGKPILLDSGCGTGSSTRRLAEMYPDYLVVGVDRSLARLGKSGLDSGVLKSENWLLARAELATFWRLLHRDGIRLAHHLLLYPNPWPKPGHLQRRWHAHPVFPWLLALGGEIELRCNWEIYALEFAKAVGIATGRAISAEQYQTREGISPFEIKYLERGHALWSVRVPAEITRGIQPAE